MRTTERVNVPWKVQTVFFEPDLTHNGAIQDIASANDGITIKVGKSRIRSFKMRTN